MWTQNEFMAGELARRRIGSDLETFRNQLRVYSVHPGCDVQQNVLIS